MDVQPDAGIILCFLRLKNDLQTAVGKNGPHSLRQFGHSCCPSRPDIVYAGHSLLECQQNGASSIFTMQKVLGPRAIPKNKKRLSLPRAINHERQHRALILTGRIKRTKTERSSGYPLAGV